MAKFGRWVYKNGEWEEGQASPELISENTRDLPGELVTKDIGDAKKVHEEDPDYIREQLIREHGEEQLKNDTSLNMLEGLRRLPLGEKVPLNQERIDVVVGWVIFSFVRDMLDKVQQGVDVDVDQVFHLWFPEDNANNYQLRAGNPPSDGDRPRHLRGYRLGFAVTDPPKRVLDIMERAGFGLTNILQTYKENCRYIAHAEHQARMEAVFG